MNLPKSLNQLSSHGGQELERQASNKLPELRLNFRENTYTNNYRPYSAQVNVEQSFRKNMVKAEILTNDLWMEIKVKNKSILKRNNHICVIYDNKLYVHGGYEINTGILDDFHYISIEEDFTMNYWIPIEAKSNIRPGPLQRHSGIVYNQRLYVFGGQQRSTKNVNDMWYFDFNTLKWHLVNKSKSIIQAPCLDSHRCNLYTNDYGEKSALIISCGYLGNNYEYTNQILQFELESEKWTILFPDTKNLPNVPEGRGSHGAVILQNNLYIFGGTDGDLRYNDLWKFDLVSLSWTEIKTNNSPEPRSGHTMLLYSDEYIIVFGGIQEITRERDDIVAFSVKLQDWLIIQKESTFTQTISPVRRTLNQNDFDKNTIKSGEKPHSLTVIYPRDKSALRSHSTKSKTVFQQKNNSPTQHTPRRNSRENTSLYVKTDKETNSMYINISGLPNPIHEKSLTNSATSALKATKEEKRKRSLQIKKEMLLSKFEISDPEQKSLLQMKSPTTEAMKSSIVALNYKRGNQNDDKKKGTLDTFEGFHIPMIQIIPTNGKIPGHRPCARDGHSSIIYKEHMIVFGGDRHKMSFNDLYVLNLEKAIKEAEPLQRLA